MAAKVRFLCLLASIAGQSLFAQNAKPSTEEGEKPTSKKAAAKPVVEDDRYYSVLGLGKNIPDAGYFRIRNILRFSDGDETIDANGKGTKSGYSYFQAANLVSIEASVTDRFAFLVALPYVYRNDLTLNIKTFRASDRYKTEVAKYSALVLKKLATGLEKAGVCPDPTTCTQVASQKISSNEVLPSSTMVLPTGETVSIPASTGTQINSLIGDLVTNAALPNAGATGISDLDFGGSYSLILTQKQVLNLGFGFRVPLGRLEDVPAAQLPTGEGMLQYGIRMSYDLLLGKGLLLSVQDQAVGMIIPGRRKKSSLLDPGQLNKGDPTTDEAIASDSDGASNAQIVTKKGLSHDLIVRADFGAALLSKSLQPLAIEASYNRRIVPEIYYDDTLMYPEQISNSVAYGFKIDGLGFARPFPAYARVLKEKFLDGKNVPIATDSLYFEISIYQVL